jgi:hypothetical protein
MDRACGCSLARPQMPTTSANGDRRGLRGTTANGLPLATLNRRHFEPLTIFGLTLL